MCWRQSKAGLSEVEDTGSSFTGVKPGLQKRPMESGATSPLTIGLSVVLGHGYMLFLLARGVPETPENIDNLST